MSARAMIREFLIFTAVTAALPCVVVDEAFAQAGVPYIEQPAEDPTEAPEPEPDPGAVAPEATPDAAEPAEQPARSPAPVTPTVASQPELYGLSPGSLTERWQERLTRVHNGDTRGADLLLQSIVEAKQDSGWPNAAAIGLAVGAEALEVLAAGDEARASRLAEAGRRLAPLEPRAYLVDARAQWAAGEYRASVTALASALRVSWSNPWEVRMRLANVGIGAAFALLVAMGLFALASVYRHFGSLRYGLRNLLPAGSSKLQASIIVAAVLLAPLVVGIGLMWTLLLWSIAGALHYEMRERIGALLVIAYLAAIPFFLPLLLEPIGYTGSRAHDSYLAGTDIGAEAAAARVAAQPAPTPEEQFILGLRALWSGDINLAAEWLQKAADRDDSTPELYVSLGNIEYARGNIQKATEVYNVAINRDPENVMALFNLSRLKFSQTLQQEAGELHRRANEMDYATVERWSEEAKRIGPTYVVRPTVPRHVLDRGHEDLGASTDAAMDIWYALAGGAEPRRVLIGAGVALLLLLSGALYRRRASRVERRKDPSQALERIRHEIEVHRHQARIARLRKIFAVIFAGAGQLIGGRSVLGMTFAAVFLTCLLATLSVLGLIPRLVPYDGGPRLLALVTAIGGALACYGVALWDNARAED